MPACVHMDDAQWCEYHRTPDLIEVTDGMWLVAFQETSLPAEVPQVTATIVPVPTTTRVEFTPRTKWGGHGGSLPRNEHPSATVLVERPDDTERLLGLLVAGRPDWVR